MSQEIDLDAIRARDAGWSDRHPARESAGRDRRELLKYLDALESLVAEIEQGLASIKRVHREHYRPKPQEDAAEVHAEQQAERRQVNQRKYDKKRRPK